MEKPRAGVEINRYKLKEISEVSIDTSKPCEERVRDFIKQIGDPYHYLDHGVVVSVGFAKDAPSLQERLAAFAAMHTDQEIIGSRNLLTSDGK